MFYLRFIPLIPPLCLYPPCTVLNEHCSSVQHNVSTVGQKSRCFWFGCSAAPHRVLLLVLLLLLLLLLQVQTGMSAGLRTLLLVLPLLLLLLLLLQRCCCYVVKRAKHGCEGHMVEERRGSSGTLGASSAGTNGHSRLSSNQEKEATNRGGGWVGG